MKTPIPRIALTFALVAALASCGEQTPPEQSFDNHAIFDAIQQELEERHLTLEEFIEKNKPK